MQEGDIVIDPYGDIGMVRHCIVSERFGFHTVRVYYPAFSQADDHEHWYNLDPDSLVVVDSTLLDRLYERLEEDD